MRILMINKFLYPNGGSETYIFEIGKQLQVMGHQVQFFGMEHEGRIVGNRAESYTSQMDFHTGKLEKLLYPFKIIYSVEARKKLRAVLDDFDPDAVHLNNFNFQLTPSILYEIRSYEKKAGHPIKIIYTAHDYQLICPNHLLYIPEQSRICTECLGGKYKKCTENRCIHGSKAKSLIGSLESYLYHKMGTYRMIDVIICPSRFLKEKLDTDSVLRERTIAMHNFVNVSEETFPEKENYVLYFGRYCKEKGTDTLLNVCRKLPEISFVFAGNGPMEEEVNQVENVVNKGFLTGDELKETIQKARFTVFTSEWYENCPFSVMESQIYGTPVIASDLGGTKELLQDGKTGLLFSGGNEEELRKKIQWLWNRKEENGVLIQGCQEVNFDSSEEYCRKLLEIYQHKNC